MSIFQFILVWLILSIALFLIVTYLSKILAYSLAYKQLELINNLIDYMYNISYTVYKNSSEKDKIIKAYRVKIKHLTTYGIVEYHEETNSLMLIDFTIKLLCFRFTLDEEAANFYKPDNVKFSFRLIYNHIMIYLLNKFYDKYINERILADIKTMYFSAEETEEFKAKNTKLILFKEV